MNLQRVEEIEKRMDELEVELESLNGNTDKELVKKRSEEIIEESQKLSSEMFNILSQISESLGIDLNDLDNDESELVEKVEE